MEGCQIENNLSVNPHSANFIFSNWRCCITALTQFSFVGGQICFQFRRTNIFARRVAKATRFYFDVERIMSCVWTPNMAIIQMGPIDLPNTSDILSKMEHRILGSLGQDQNISAKVAGDCLHWLHRGSTVGHIFESFLFDEWSLSGKEKDEAYVVGLGNNSMFAIVF